MNEQTESQPEIWQAEIDETVRSLSFDELAALISSGTLLRADKVRRGNLRWLEAGRVPALDAYFAYADAPAESAGPPLERPKSIGIPPVVIEPAAAPAPVVSSSSVIKSFVYVLLLSLVFTYLWMYYRDAKDRTAAQTAVAGVQGDPESIREVEANYETRKKFLVDQNVYTERMLAKLNTESSKLTPTVNTSMCYQFRNVPRDTHYYFDSVQPAVERELDPLCVEQQKANAHKQAILAERDRVRMKADLSGKSAEFAADLQELEAETQSERDRVTQGFYMAAAKGRFYYGFIPIFLILVLLNTARIILRKKITQPQPALN
jgi:hypothetical protein